MKVADWKNVKVGTTLILADIHRGVFRVRVTEIDVEITVDHPTYHKARPYGLTKDRGIVQIMVGETVELGNLLELIKFTTSMFNTLTKNYLLYSSYLDTANEFKEAFRDLVNIEKAK
ncbi:hypothetical protein ES703_02114 [subsurface metagenome]